MAKRVDHTLAEMLGMEKGEVEFVITPHNNTIMLMFQKTALQDACERFQETATKIEFMDALDRQKEKETVNCDRCRSAKDGSWYQYKVLCGPCFQLMQEERATKNEVMTLPTDVKESPAVAYLKSIEWSMGCGSDKNEGQCDVCTGISPAWLENGNRFRNDNVAGHKRDCKLAAAIPGALYVDEKVVTADGFTIRQNSDGSGSITEPGALYVDKKVEPLTEKTLNRLLDEVVAANPHNLIAERRLEATVKEKLNQITEHERAILAILKRNTASLKCTCGVEAVGGVHSSWCDTERA